MTEVIALLGRGTRLNDRGIRCKGHGITRLRHRDRQVERRLESSRRGRVARSSQKSFVCFVCFGQTVSWPKRSLWPRGMWPRADHAPARARKTGASWPVPQPQHTHVHGWFREVCCTNLKGPPAWHGHSAGAENASAADGLGVDSAWKNVTGAHATRQSGQRQAAFASSLTRTIRTCWRSASQRGHREMRDKPFSCVLRVSCCEA
jgi:hypothetical protein